uniref:G protein-coupled receptor n=1 Tax=Haemonchus contortus TaxID=6289 RepID=A0A7I4YQE5_HAECO
MDYQLVVGTVGFIVVSTFILYCDVLFIISRNRQSNRFNSAFFRLWWNQGFFDVFSLIFFTATMYSRCFDAMVPVFLYLNRYPIWKKFALVTQELIMYTQATTVVMELGVRLMTMCLPSAHITEVVDHLPKWMKTSYRSSIATIHYCHTILCIFNFQYGLQGTNVPLLLSTSGVTYDTSIFFIGLVYRVTALVLCLCGYFYMFDTIRRKGARAEFKILLHGVCLVIALIAVITSSLCRRFKIGESYQLVRVAFLSTMLWIPCTNILVTIYTTKSLRSRLLNPLLPDKTSVVAMTAMTQLHRTSTRVKAWHTDHKP